MNEVGSSLKAAQAFVSTPADYKLTEIEEQALAPFFTSIRGRVFIVHNLPENMIAVLMAMYSRLNNPRGIRGVFLDNFLLSVLATLTPTCEARFGGDPKKFLDHYGYRTLDDFVALHGPVFEHFMRNFELDVQYLERLVASSKMRVFLNTWLDAYGHNSIARVGAVHICFENISILAAKSLEWSRPGSAFIELSTRYVKMSAAGLYPIWDELAVTFGMDPEYVEGYLRSFFETYQELQGDSAKLDGPFPAFLRSRYGDAVADPKKLEMGIFGETCDVLGNLLPAATLTSVGITVSGEALPGVIRHLRLDNTAENHAIAEAIIAECGKTGASQFISYAEITPWDSANWVYLAEGVDDQLTDRYVAEEAIWNIARNGQHECADFDEYIEYLDDLQVERSQYGKLGRPFEAVTATFGGIMSFRGWRDLQRMGMATHFRSRIDPANGFYVYDKPAPSELEAGFAGARGEATRMWAELSELGVPVEVREYLMPLGILVHYAITANLRQCEFMNWQRSKSSVNHEVRQAFLEAEALLCEEYPWWARISRADTTPAYIFARGSAIPLPVLSESAT